MKKILGIIVLSFFLSGNAYAAELFPKKELTRKEITNEWLKNKTITDLKLLGFVYWLRFITSTENSVQYYLSKNAGDGSVSVICFVNIENTICRLP